MKIEKLLTSSKFLRASYVFCLLLLSACAEKNKEFQASHEDKDVIVYKQNFVPPQDSEKVLGSLGSQTDFRSMQSSADSGSYFNFSELFPRGYDHRQRGT